MSNPANRLQMLNQHLGGNNLLQISFAGQIGKNNLGGIVPERRVSGQTPHSLLMIPGPVEFSDSVLQSMSRPPVAHTGPVFVDIFANVLRKTRLLFGNDRKSGGQPVIVSGSGTLGWDFVGANLITNPSKDNILCISTGFFSNGMYESLCNYVDDENRQVTLLEAEVGGVIDLTAIGEQLVSKPYSLIALTHTDTSTGVLLDIKKISKLVHELSPNTLIAVDAVCSAGVEEIQFDNWGLDFVLAASQKAISTPAGLCIMMVSDRAINKNYSVNKKKPLYCSLNKWLPIMINYENHKPSYFSTPSVQLISALNTSLTEIFESEAPEIDESTKIPIKLHERFNKHSEMAQFIRSELVGANTGLSLVSTSIDTCCNGMTALYLPDSVRMADFLGYVSKNFDITLAGGIHPKFPTKYIRIGHMGVSVTGENGQDVRRTVAAIQATMKALSNTESVST